MKRLLICLIFPFLISQLLNGQENNILRGKMLFQSSGKKPAVGVEISGKIDDMENANIVYTTNNGAYNLTFPNGRKGYPVLLEIGEADQDGIPIEVVNDKELEDCKIPARPSDEFDYQAMEVHNTCVLEKCRQPQFLFFEHSAYQ